LNELIENWLEQPGHLSSLLSVYAQGDWQRDNELFELIKIQ
jgi:hypothetical protein